MKKLVLFLFAAAFVLTVLPACNDMRADYPRYKYLMTVRLLDDGDYYFERDNGEKLHVGNKSRVGGYTPQDGQRTVIWFNILSGRPQGYDYDIALYAAEPIYTGTSQVITEQSELDALGNAPADIIPEYGSLSRKWLTLYIGYLLSDNSKHSFTLIVNKLEDPQEGTSGYLDVELRHNPGGETAGYTRWNYVSFDLSGLGELLNGKKGVYLRVQTHPNRTEYIRYNLPSEK